MSSPIKCTFSPCREYRYTWEYEWDRVSRPCAFIGLNPSTADEDGPDPTVRRCINFARDWGYGSLLMLNIFSYRATERARMRAHLAPIAPPATPTRNDHYLRRTVARVVQADGVVIAAWGTDGAHLARGAAVRSMLASFPLHHLVLTRSGEPGHPLYLRGSLKPVPLR